MELLGDIYLYSVSCNYSQANGLLILHLPQGKLGPFKDYDHK